MGRGETYSSLYSKKLCQINSNSCLERAMRCVKFMCTVLVPPVCFWMHEGNLWEISPYLGCLYIYSILQDRALYVKDLLTHIIVSSPTDSFTIYKAVTSGLWTIGKTNNPIGFSLPLYFFCTWWEAVVSRRSLSIISWMFVFPHHKCIMLLTSSVIVFGHGTFGRYLV